MRPLLSRLPMPVGLAMVYAAIGGAWIVLNHGGMAWIWGQPNPSWLADSLTGFLFVAVSVLIFCVSIRRLVARYEEAEAALRASDERWRFALEGAGDGVWDWNGETQKAFFSPGWKAMLGYADSEIGDRREDWEERIHPEDRARAVEQFKLHCLGQTEAYVCEHRLRTKDGTYKWILSRGRTVVRAADGRPIRVIGTHADITARKEAEARMTDALNFERTILQAAPVGIFTYRADGQAVSVNEAAAKIIGASVEELLGQNFRRTESWRRHGLVEIADRALRENCAVFHSANFVTSFGRSIWWEGTFLSFGYGGERRLLLIVQDITGQRATRERMELLQAALEAAPTGWVVTDATGVIEWVNPGFTKLTGYSLEESVGQKPSLLKSGRHPPGFYASLWQTVIAGQIWQGELCNRRKDGSLYSERMTLAPVRDAEGAIGHFVAMKEDITGQHELEQRLARSQRLESVGLLASGLAHDLNNMLAPIMLAVGLIESRHKDRETRELLDMVQKAAQRGAGVVQQILTFARGVEGERVQLDVRPLVKELAQLARETFPREIRIVVDVPGAALLVDGDVTQLHQVLLNLAVNARDAMPDGGVLTLKARVEALGPGGTGHAAGVKPGAYVKLSLTDTGTGITEEVLEHIFEPFFTTKPRGKGTGLGLSTVYGIVRSHGGFVDVSSKLGEGTEFSVWLPASLATTTAASPARAVPALRGAGRVMLVVDDEASIRQVVSQVLGKWGFLTVEAEDGLEALQRLREQPGRFSAAIVDLMMPGMNGFKLVGEIRLLAPALPIVVVSGMTGEFGAGQNLAALTALGVRTVLRKPFAAAGLLEALNAEMNHAAAMPGVVGKQ